MCGLAGFLDPSGFSDDGAARRLLRAMRDRIAHRGPDDSGLWLDGAAGLALGFRRLSILDLSEAGHQPMRSADGRYVVAMNGEIYNFAEIRAEIEAACGPLEWRGHSDTEILVEAVALWGVESAVRRANGMFALAVWDRKERALWLARDRIGKKPLFYGWAGRAFLFGSELKALWPHPDFDTGIDPDALANFLQLGYVPGARTIFAAMSKLPGGHLLRLDRDAAFRRAVPAPSAYWSLRAAALNGLDAQAAGRGADTEEFEALARDAVALRMVADVPVGAFLSGGIDSSLVTALMTQALPGAVRSFSIGFTAGEWDEAPHARAVAAHLGTAHQEMYVGPAEVMAMVDELPAISDEPFADDSMIPTALLCRLARRSVTVALSGDGGDELFAGYRRYALAQAWLDRRDAIPGFAIPLARRLVDRLARPAAGRWGRVPAERRMQLLGQLLASGRPEAFNEAMMSQLPDPGALLADPDAPRHPLTDGPYCLGRSGAVDRMTFMDAGSYLIDDILAKVDRASMAASLEVRCPLLDYRIIEMSWRFPARDKLRDGVGKLPLRAVLDRHVPRALVDRPKMGFGAPVEAWLRNGLRGWAEALMSREALGRHGLLDVAACRRLWEDFAERDRGWHRAIWNLLMFQAWHAWMTEAARAKPQAASVAQVH